MQARLRRMRWRLARVSVVLDAADTAGRKLQRVGVCMTRVSVAARRVGAVLAGLPVAVTGDQDQVRLHSDFMCSLSVNPRVLDYAIILDPSLTLRK
jgi:hypothetical protein